MNRKGFTLIEILAVIVILSMLIFIAVPVVSKYVMNSRKEVFAENAHRAIAAVNNNNLKQQYLSNASIDAECNDDVCYYDLNKINQLLSKQLDDSPFGAQYDKVNSKVLSVEMNDAGKTSYVYFMCLYDIDHNGFSYTRQKDINSQQVQLGNINNCGNAFEYINC